MRRALLPTTAALAALTAALLWWAVVAIRPPPLPGEADAPGEAANRALVVAFYEAANAAIATGDPAALGTVLAPDFVERDSVSGAGAGREGLVRRLLAIHAADPAPRLEPDALAADGDLVIAQVRVVGAAPAAFAGLRLAEDWVAWGPLDVFRVEGGRIVERWGPPADPAPPPAQRVALELPSPKDRTLVVGRLTLAPGARHVETPRDGVRLVLVEAGTVELRPVADRPAASPPEVLVAGGHEVVPVRTGFAATNPGETPAVLLDVAFEARPRYAARRASPPPPEEGGIVEVLADDLLVAVPARAAVLSVGRVVLDPGDTFGWDAPAGPVLVHVEAGAVGLRTGAPVPWVRAEAGERPEVGDGAALSTGGGALLEPGTWAEVRADAGFSATVLVVSLLPADPSAPRDHPTRSP